MKDKIYVLLIVLSDMKIKLKNKEVEIPVKQLSILGKFKGLMFSRREKAEILLFEFYKPTKNTFHSLFCFFPFYILWIDQENNVLEVKKCKLWRLKIVPSPRVKSYSKVIEIPINKKNESILKIIDEEKI